MEYCTVFMFQYDVKICTHILYTYTLYTKDEMVHYLELST